MKAFIQHLLARAGYRIEGIRYTPRHLLDPRCLRTLQFDDVVCRRMFEHEEKLTFIQIGAYDGISTDPLRKFIQRCGWRGVMLEPQPGPAAQLRKLYAGNDNIVILEAALDRQRCTRSLFTVESDLLPKWSGGMASFDRDHILRHDCLIPGLADHLRELKVACIPFDDVLAALPEPRLDLLQIDVEGADGYLISLFPFERLKPAIIQWESKNMSRTQQEETLERLCGHGYRVSRSDEDTLAVLDA